MYNYCNLGIFYNEITGDVGSNLQYTRAEANAERRTKVRDESKKSVKTE
jgi:hypothetical protein